MDEARLRNQLGKAIAKHRKARGMTQEQLAEVCDVTPVWVSQLERGIGLPSLDGLVRLAEALRADAPALLAAGLESHRRECDDELVAELPDMDPDAVEVLTLAARALKGRWPRPPGKV